MQTHIVDIHSNRPLSISPFQTQTTHIMKYNLSINIYHPDPGMAVGWNCGMAVGMGICGATVGTGPLVQELDPLSLVLPLAQAVHEADY
jgi:hypothetical protein